MAAADAATKPLVVFIVFFGELPPWLPLTLTSMAMNARVQFVVVGDAAPPPLIPQNVRFEQISYPAMQSRLAKLIEADVRYNWTYKGNDIKPAAPALYPHLVAGYEWWAWADLDVVFGNLLKYLELAEAHPACCKGLEQTCHKRLRRDPPSSCYNSTRARWRRTCMWRDRRARFPFYTIREYS